MREYRINELSKILNLSAETLRHYERLGIIHPRRDGENGYRYYTNSEFNALIESKWLRSLDFSLPELQQLLCSDDLQTYDSRCGQKELEILRTIDACQRKLKKIHDMRRSIRNLNDNLGKLSIVKTEQLIFQPCRSDRELFLDPETVELNWAWMERMPDVRHSFMLTHQAPGAQDTFDSYLIGFSLPYQEAIRDPALFGSRTEILPPSIAIYSIYYIAPGSHTLEAVETQVLSRIRQAGCQICGVPYGHQIARAKVDEHICPFFEIWVPVEMLPETNNEPRSPL